MALDPVFLNEESDDGGRRSRRAFVAAALVVALAIGGIGARSVMLPPSTVWLAWTIIVGTAVIQAGTAGHLWGTLQTIPRRSVAVLATALLGCAGVDLVAALTLPGNIGEAPMLALHSQAGIWVLALWIDVSILGALGYAAIRRHERAGRSVPEAAVTTAAAIVAVVASGGTAVAVLGSDLLPPLMIDGMMTGLRSTGIGYVEALLAFAAAGAIWRDPRRANRLDHGVALWMVAVGLDVSLVLIDPKPMTGGSFAARLLGGVGPVVLFAAAAGRLISAYGSLGRASGEVGRARLLALRQSQRLAAVWRLSRDEHLSDSERVQALLDAGTSTLRPGRPFFGQIAHIEGDDLVVDYVSDASAREDRMIIGPRYLTAGRRVPLALTLQHEIAVADTTTSFSDLNEIDHGLRRERTHSTPYSSLIGNAFTVGNTRHLLGFFSTEPMKNDPFTDEDRAFVDVLCSFLSARFHQSQQLEKIRYQIEHDLLTGLPSRAKFRAAAMKNLALRIPCAVAIVSLDRFREINEMFGHMIGDALLVEIAAALGTARQSGDFVARLGGDNFAILIDDVSSGIDIEARLQPYRDVFATPFGTGDRDGKDALHVGASFGVALYPQDAEGFDELLARADAAVEAAKQRQRGSVAYFNEQLEQSIQRRRALYGELAGALVEQQLAVRYHPIIDLNAMTLVGAEALVRWQHPLHGLVLPEEFVPFAEASGLIGRVGSFVLDRVLSDLATLPSIPEDFICFLNLSSPQLRDLAFATALRDRFGTHPDLASHLGVEITESAAMQDVDRMLDALAVLRELGVAVALDNFGTGFSSFPALERFSLDLVKIDRRFVRGLPEERHDATLVETMLSVTSKFGFEALAEGIETMEQFAWLRDRGCRYGQGFLITQPMQFSELAGWIERKTFTFGRS